MNLFDLNHDNKASLLSMMLTLLKADNKEKSEEWQFLEQVSKEIGISLSELDKPKDGLQIPKMEKDRMAMFYYLLFLCKIDGDLDKEEEATIQEYALKLGFNELMARDFLYLIRKNINQAVPISDMLEVIKKYMN